MNPNLVVLMAENKRMNAELEAQRLYIRDKIRENEAQAAEITRLKKDARNHRLREDAHKRKIEEVTLVTDVNLVNSELTGPKAVQQIRAYERFARECSLDVGELDFTVGRLVPERRLRLVAIVQRLGPIVQSVGQSGQERVECLD
jgi:hypothetical protein